MGALVGALRAMLTLDSTAFVSGANKAQKSGKKLESGLATLGGAMKKVGLGLAIAAAGLGAAIKGQLNAADEMGKAAQKFGIGVEELSRLNYAAKLSDVSLETLGTGLRGLSKNMLAASNGSKTAGKLFSELGVSVTDSAGKMRSTEAVLQDVADVLSRMPDGAEKTALAMKVFGKSGAELLPMLNGGKTGLQAMAEEANRLGVVIDAKTAKSAENFNDNLTRLGAAMGGLVMQITAALAPTLEKLSQWAVDVSNAFGKLSPETRNMIVQIGAIVGVVSAAAASFGVLGLALSPLTVTISAIATGALLIYENWGPIAAWFSEQWAAIRNATEEAWEAIKAAIGGAIDWVQGKWDTFVASLKAAIQIAKDVGQAIKDALTATPMAPGGGFEGGGGGGGKSGGAFIKSSYDTGRAGADGQADGFVTGTNERLGDYAAAAESITRIVRNTWQVASPSRVFREIGAFLTEGLSLGIKDNVPMVDAAMGEVGDAVEGRADSFKSAFESMRSTLSGTFSGLVTGALSFKDALSQVIGKLAEMLAQSAFEGLMGAGGNGLLGGIMKLFGFADGGAFQGSRLMAFANGGVVSGATAFAMQGGLGVMGEAGPEAIMPLARGRGGKLGVVAQGGGASRVQIEITENPMFASRVEGIADGRAVQVVRKYDREIAPQSRNRNPRERG